MKHRAHKLEPYFKVLRETAEEYHLFEGADSVVLALSGGKDSVCLFHLLRHVLPEYGVAFSCAHVNHRLRGTSSVRDERFCRQLCETYGVEFASFSCDVLPFARERGLSVEDAARTLRYELLLRHAKEKGARLATAHSASDNTESVFLKLARGGGLRAACGIEPFRSDGVIRPMLAFTTQDVLSACAVGGFSYVTDATNRDTRYLRNFCRRDILKKLRKRIPNLDASVLRFSSIARREHTAYLALARRHLEEAGLFPVTPRMPLAPILALLSDPEISTVSYLLFSQMLKAAGCELALSEERHSSLCAFLLAHAHTPAFFEVGCGFGFLKERDSLFACAHTSDVHGCLEGDALVLGEHRITLKNGYQRVEKVHKMHTSACIDCDKIVGQLFLRGRLPSDVYTVNGRTRSVREYFSMRHIPQGERKDYPLVCDASGVVWIPGELADDRVRAETDGNTQVLQLTHGSVLYELEKRRQYE